MSLNIRESLKRLAETLKACIKEDIESITEEFDGVNTAVAILYFGSFAGLILSVCLMGVDGDILWGITAFLFAMVVLFVGFMTGVF